METTDYSKIASVYDNNEDRHLIEIDEHLKSLFEKRPNEKSKVLEIGCGTGNYLVFQKKAYKHESVKWIGLDLSKEMLNVAQPKLSGVELINSSAEELPFKNESFDFIVTRFAFHHFSKKERALDEMWRILKRGCILKYENFLPEKSDWWVHRYFPETQEITNKRFWSTEKTRKAFEEKGFKTSMSINIDEDDKTVLQRLKEARNRDISHLRDISESAYEAGLLRMQREIDRSENVKSKGTFALMTCIALKE